MTYISTIGTQSPPFNLIFNKSLSENCLKINFNAGEESHVGKPQLDGKPMIN